jgi:hypothetical protein
MYFNVGKISDDSADPINATRDPIATKRALYSWRNDGNIVMVLNRDNMLGVGTFIPDKALEVNSATGAVFRGTYNDPNGSAANYCDMAVSSGGDLTVTPSGGDVNIEGTLTATGGRIFSPTLSATGTASGDIITVTFGESVVFGDMVYPDSTDNEWKKALATNAATTYPTMGMVLESKGDSEVGQLLLRGVVRDDTIFAGASSGDIVFLSDATAGDVVYAAPADAGDIVQHLGFALGAGYIYFNPCYTYVER